jgi:hypothetical protein
MTNYPEYVCHKTVRAFKILAIKEDERNCHYELVPDDLTLLPAFVSHDWINKHNPKMGGYFVVYKDGYMSYSPANVFESGYTRCEEES